MSNGQVLKCEYGFVVTPGNYFGLPEDCYPDECDVGDPTYYIDDEEVDYAKLPKGLAVIADAMYIDSHNTKFHCVEEQDEPYFDDSYLTDY